MQRQNKENFKTPKIAYKSHYLKNKKKTRKTKDKKSAILQKDNANNILCISHYIFSNLNRSYSFTFLCNALSTRNHAAISGTATKAIIQLARLSLGDINTPIITAKNITTHIPKCSEILSQNRYIRRSFSIWFIIIFIL